MSGTRMERTMCTARSKSTGVACKMWAIPGGKTCRFHGSSTKRARAAAARREAEAAARAAVVTFGLPRDIDPGAALLEEVHRTAGAVAWLETKIRDLNDEDLVWGMTRIKQGGDDRGTTFEAKPNVWLVEYRTERKHLVEVCRIALAAGIDERRVRLAEQQGDLLVTAIRDILDGLSLTSKQKQLVGVVVPRVLRAVGA